MHDHEFCRFGGDVRSVGEVPTLAACLPKGELQVDAIAHYVDDLSTAR
jgi:hypothetical protein